MQVRNWCRTWGPGLPPAFTGSSLLCFSRRAQPKWLDRQMSVTISAPASLPKRIPWAFPWRPSTSMHRRNRLPRSADLLLPVTFEYSSRLILLSARHAACRLNCEKCSCTTISSYIFNFHGLGLGPYIISENGSKSSYSISSL